LTVRFPPIYTRRVRLVEDGPGGRWSVAELFLLGPPGPGASPDAAADLLADGRRLEELGQVGPALLRYREAIRRAPDDPAGYAAFVRLSTRLRGSAGSPLRHAAWLAERGLLTEARSEFAEVSRSLGAGQVHAELWRRRAHLAEADGDPGEAARLGAEADAATAPVHDVGALMGGVVELVGYDVAPRPLRAGETAELTTHWRLHAGSARGLMAWVHLRADDRAAQDTRFGDDYPLPGFLPDLGPGSQHVSIRREVRVPADALPGRYRLVAGVWNPASGRRLSRWWRGLLPTRETTLELGRIEIVRAVP
jgi:hypothetical protein